MKKHLDLSDFVDTSWTNTEKVCFIAHIWADKENNMEFLKDFDFADMAKAANQFIASQPDNVDFIVHIENCFEILEKECLGVETPEWTKEYFMKYY